MTKSIRKEFRFEASHRLPLHEGACRNLHGHSYKVVVEVSGEEQIVGPATDMVMDFKVLSEVVNNVLFEGVIDGRRTVPFDHSVILWEEDPLIQILKKGVKDNLLPQDLRIAILIKQPTAEYMAELFKTYFQHGICEKGIDATVTAVEVWETAKACAIAR